MRYTLSFILLIISSLSVAVTSTSTSIAISCTAFSVELGHEAAAFFGNDTDTGFLNVLAPDDIVGSPSVWDINSKVQFTPFTITISSGSTTLELIRPELTDGTLLFLGKAHPMTCTKGR